MKYAALYELAKQREYIVFNIEKYPESIVMPVSGYAVQASPDDDMYIFLSTAFAEDDFEYAVDEALDKCSDIGVRYIMVERDGDEILVAPAQVFASKDYAMGYAHGVMSTFIRDLFNDKRITRKVK